MVCFIFLVDLICLIQIPQAAAKICLPTTKPFSHSQPQKLSQKFSSHSHENSKSMTGIDIFYSKCDYVFMLNLNYLQTSCPGAPVAPRNAASRHADRLDGQVRNRKYSTFRDPGGVKVLIPTLRKSSGHSSTNVTRLGTFAEKLWMCDNP